MNRILKKWNDLSLIFRIACGLVLGVILGLIFPNASAIGILGDIFVGALKSIAPILVFFLVLQNRASQRENGRRLRFWFTDELKNNVRLATSYLIKNPSENVTAFGEIHSDKSTQIPSTTRNVRVETVACKTLHSCWHYIEIVPEMFHRLGQFQ